ncbi:MAG: DUF624 domain-containing protein [Lachnospiraceae bacterium]|nr:DUF624 domain-containing protein [Lachnospiraceae bacterium]
MKFLSLDSPLMRFLGRMADLLWLNLLTAMFFLPGLLALMSFGTINAVVILAFIPVLGAGAAITALHYVCLKLVRNEEGYITKDFFRSFKENFVQATVIWVLFLLGAALLFADFRIVFLSTDIVGTFRIVMIGGLILVTLLFLFTSLFVFPVLSHFKNTIRGTIKNAFLMSLLVLPKTVLMVVIVAIPPLACFIYQLIPVAALFFFGAPAFVCALLYNKTFKRFEPEPEETPSDFDWTVSEEEGEEIDGDQ